MNKYGSKLRKTFVKWVVLPIAFILVATWTIYNLYRDFAQDPVRFSLVLITITIASLGYKLRKKQIKAYGFIEFLLGFMLTMYAAGKSVLYVPGNLASTIHSFRDINTNYAIANFEWPATISGIYFIIRSFDNIEKALRVERKLADNYNRNVKENFEELVRVEANAIWLKKGKPHNSQVEDWSQAEININKLYKYPTLASFWKSTFGLSQS